VVEGSAAAVGTGRLAVRTLTRILMGMGTAMDRVMARGMLRRLLTRSFEW